MPNDGEKLIPIKVAHNCVLYFLESEVEAARARGKGIRRRRSFTKRSDDQEMAAAAKRELKDFPKFEC